MKEILLQYAQYNAWANKLIIDVMLTVTDEQLDMPISSSFPSIRATAYHTWGAEAIWLQRLQLAEHSTWAPDTFTGTFAAACADWQKASAAVISFIEKQYNDQAMTHVVEFRDRQGKAHKQKTSYILQHVFNHATYHRGQLVTMLRQVGVTTIPSTDLIYFVQKK